MREAVFLRQNQERWHHYETQPPTGPDELAQRFIELTDDLSYARTFYPNSTTTAYLNGLASKLHQALYKNKTEDTSRFSRFWRLELPLLVVRHRGVLLGTVLFFLLCTAIGALSAALDDTFVRVVLGDRYVNQTLANIQKGDPMAIYKGTDETLMFLQITLNNVKVSLLAFAGGITGGLLTGYMLFQNGVMLGSFQEFFHQKGVLLPSVLTIWIHGTLEISAIVLAGGAGLIMARSLLFPGTYSRRDALRLGARDGMKLVLGLVPIFIVAGFLEGFVTRHTEMPMWASLTIIGISASFILGYFVVYPWWLYRRGARLPEPTAF
ncbi:stage II sporulation protein M [Hymenobacter wooponensis]|uniref:Stage II sporulation protein M n=1 Tax=Hymenobacter wooponensis TaxID=1525360 RepID=A0A4Z0MI66_9BACT|nr:stage II sporulation protein M [Hymenobacter wooponensis]TGD78875.1 stage II sporulation protein M [Hymenobacter wooponensis]